MAVPKSCPACDADLRGDEISPEERALFGGETHYSRVLGLYDLERDTTVAWQCPVCGHRWAITEPLPMGMRNFNLFSLL